MNEQRKAFEAWATSYEDAWNEYGMRRNADDEYEQDQVRMQWEGWQAAITSQAPRQALSDAEIMELVAVNFNRTLGGDWIADRGEILHFARAIAAASGPNAALVEALKGILNLPRGTSGRIILDRGDELTVRAALAAVGEGE